MGEIANDIINGACCDLCGQYFLDPVSDEFLYEHGYPVTCWECWEDLTKSEKEDRIKAEVDTL